MEDSRLHSYLVQREHLELQVVLLLNIYNAIIALWDSIVMKELTLAQRLHVLKDIFVQLELVANFKTLAQLDFTIQVLEE